MVHLNRVATDIEVSESKKTFVDSFSKLAVVDEDEADDYTATVYGSKYAAEDLPKHEMPVCFIYVFSQFPLPYYWCSPVAMWVMIGTRVRKLTFMCFWM